MTKAIWNGQVLADSDQTIRIEGNHKDDFIKCAGKDFTNYVTFWHGVEVQ